MRRYKLVGILVSLVILLVILISPSKQQSIRTINISRFFENRTNGHLYLIYIFDSRADQAASFIKDLNYYVEKNNNKLVVGMILLNGADVDIRGNYELLDRRKFERVSLPRNTYYLFDKYGNYIREGSMLDFPRDLKGVLDRLFGVKEVYRISDDLKLAGYISSSTFSTTIGNTYLDKQYTCYTSYENICLGCESGYALLEFEKLMRFAADYGFFYISVYDYTMDDISRFRRDNQLSTNILLADRSLKTRWTEIANITNQEHPLKGIIFVVSKDGRIVLITKQFQTFYSWLGKISK